MDLHEALRVACNLIKVTSYLEIGVDGGGSLNTVLCEVVPPRIVLCDIWDPKYCDHGDAKPHVLNILKHFKAQAEFLDGDSKLRIPTLLDKFDLVLVDGDHSEEGARTDLYNAWPLVRPGGILVMDDINHPNYPWLEQVWQSALQRWGWVGAERIEELHGGCNAAMVMKTT
jgi:predicted O-methyltransferase YrrM